MSTDETRWNSRSLLRWMRDRFGASKVDAPRVVAETLLAQALGCSRLALHMDPDRPTTDDERDVLREHVRRILLGEPLHYVTGQTQFWNGLFEIRPCTQIPQPCTELLVSHSLALLSARGVSTGRGRTAFDSTFCSADAIVDVDSNTPDPRGTLESCHSLPPDDPSSRGDSDPPLRMLELGVGSGAVIVSLLKALPSSLGFGVDIDSECIELATKNAENHGVAERLDLKVHDASQPVGGPFDLIVGNLPYIPDEEWPDQIDDGVRSFTPEKALRGGHDGLSIIRPAIHWASQAMCANGFIGLEHASSSADAVAALLAEAGFRNIECLYDEDELPRATFGSWACEVDSV